MLALGTVQGERRWHLSEHPRHENVRVVGINALRVKSASYPNVQCLNLDLKSFVLRFAFEEQLVGVGLELVVERP